MRCCTTHLTAPSKSVTTVCDSSTSSVFIDTIECNYTLCLAHMRGTVGMRWLFPFPSRVKTRDGPHKRMSLQTSRTFAHMPISHDHRRVPRALLGYWHSMHAVCLCIVPKHVCVHIDSIERASDDRERPDANVLKHTAGSGLCFHRGGSGRTGSTTEGNRHVS
ncbi:hypothetical protein BC628DRAFT_727460 [Trametes gibbosa]|nr:hypothetical protein BC628DRAFT_727460 [Trametes gibbosa]